MEQKETRKTVRTFAFASFLNDLGSDMIYPVWPLFVTSVLGANMAVLGFIDGLGDAIVSISQAASGYVSDRIRRRKVFIWTGYLFGSLSRVGYALSTVWQHLIPFKILDRENKGGAQRRYNRGYFHRGKQGQKLRTLEGNGQSWRCMWYHNLYFIFWIAGI